MEEWRRHNIAPSLEVSSWGRIRSRSSLQLRHPCRRDRTGTGYLAIQGGVGLVAVHRLVALAFHGEPPQGASIVRHLNSDPIDNTPGNLSWGTHAENAQDRKIANTWHEGERASGAHLTNEQAVAVAAQRFAGHSCRVVAERFGVSAGQDFDFDLPRLKAWLYADGVPVYNVGEFTYRNPLGIRSGSEFTPLPRPGE